MSPRAATDPVKVLRSVVTVVYSVRLSPERVEQIGRVAERMDVPAPALLRGWAQAGLPGQDEDSVTATIERLKADLRKPRDLIAH